ncbi:hypothetical protein scyTo_0008868, partial [Scyliorhinus torazame]|nr:hypothetical protein [Scyliorhinus torazame]
SRVLAGERAVGLRRPLHHGARPGFIVTTTTAVRGSEAGLRRSAVRRFLLCRPPVIAGRRRREREVDGEHSSTENWNRPSSIILLPMSSS